MATSDAPEPAAANSAGELFRNALRDLARGIPPTLESTRLAVLEILDGHVAEPMLAAYLTALRFTGEPTEVLAGAVEAVRSRMMDFVPSRRPILDTCGTGGDGASTVNISTATAIVVSACGVAVAKHGNRSATGNSGSSDVLEALGVRVEVSPDRANRCLEELGIAFLFAPSYHPALRLAGPVRRMLPFRTVFNLIGPLANPARPDHQLVGVPERTTARRMAEVLAAMGVARAAVVSSEDGLDEVSLGAPTHVLWVENRTIDERVWEPRDFGPRRIDASELRVDGPAGSAERIRGLLRGERGPVRDVVLANAAAALLVAGRVRTLSEGMWVATEALDWGKASSLLDRWSALSRADDQGR